jgi:hypothetical protein
MSQLLELEVVKKMMSDSVENESFIADTIITINYLEKQVYPVLETNAYLVDNLKEFFDSKNLSEVLTFIGQKDNLKFFIELVTYIRKTWTDDKTMDYHHAILRGELNTFYAHEINTNSYNVRIDYTLNVLREEFGEDSMSPDLSLEQLLAFMIFQIVNDSNAGIKFENIKDALVSPEEFANALEEF